MVSLSLRLRRAKVNATLRKDGGKSPVLFAREFALFAAPAIARERGNLELADYRSSRPNIEVVSLTLQSLLC